MRSIRNLVVVLLVVAMAAFSTGCATKQVMDANGNVQEIPVGGAGKAIGATVAGIASTGLSLLYKGNNRWVRAGIPVLGTLLGLGGGHAYDMAQADKDYFVSRLSSSISRSLNRLSSSISSLLSCSSPLV